MQMRMIMLLSVATGAMGAALQPAWGQGTDTPQPAVNSDATTDAADYDEITVTASRLNTQQGFDSPTPTTVVSSEALEQRAYPNLGDALNEFPAFRPSQNAQTAPQSSSQSGQIYADLRGLGSTRTLVLIDGRRHVPSAATGQVDLNLIPTGLVKRVEVVTGGASAAYGSDAVSGVVNVILDKDFEGFKGNVSAGLSTYGDDLQTRVSLAHGSSFADGRGHIVIGGDFVKTKGVDSYLERPWGRRADDVVSFPSNRPAGTPSRMFVSGAGYTNSPVGGVIIGPNADTNPGNGADVLRGIGFAPDGSAYSFDYGNDPGTGTAYDNTSPDASFTRLGHQLVLPVTRYVSMAHIDYDVNDSLSFFVEGSYGRSGSNYNGPTLRDTRTTSIPIQVDNAFLPTSVHDIMTANNINSFSLARANVDYDQSQPHNFNASERIVGGVQGKLGDGWTWDAYYQYGRNVYDQQIDNMRIKNNFYFALDAVVDPSTNEIVCRALLPGSSTYNPTAAAGCVPLDLFGENAPSQEASDYIHGRLFYELTTQQHVGALNLRGDLFETWAGPVSFAIGGEYRNDKTEAVSDTLSEESGYAFGNPQPFSGSLTTKEGYAEVLVPLAKDAPFARSLDLNGAVRYTDYSYSGGVTTWKVGGTWEPISGLTFRGTRSRDIRAPNASELFQVSTTTTTLRNTFSGQTRQIDRINEPAPGLEPEKADTITVGVILKPDFIPGLDISVDYYNIDIKGAISSYSPQFVIDQCVAETQGSGPDYFCSFLTMSGSGTGTIIDSVAVQLLNIASVKARGVDFDMRYRRDLGRGGLTARLFGNYTADLISDDGLGNGPSYDANGVIQSRGSVIDRAGQVGGFFSGNNNGATNAPHWQLNGSLTYAANPYSLTVQARYVGGGKVDKSLVDPSDPDYDAASPISVLNNDVNARVYINLSGSVNLIDNGEQKLQWYAVVNNVANTAPPFPATQLAGLYDRIGRYFVTGVRFNF